MVELLEHGAGGNRLAWGALPAGLRDEIEARLGDRVVRADTQAGGFSPAVAARLTLASGAGVFVKAGSGAHNPDTARMYRQEARVVAALPPSVPAPRFRWTFESGDWVVLAFDDAGTRPAAHPPGQPWYARPPALPWVPAERDRVLGALADLARSLTPAPAGVPVPELGDDATGLTGFRDLARTGHERLATAYPWVAERLDLLAEWETRWPAAALGDTLLHGDMRADNMLVTPERVLFVDWPGAVRGAAWFDLAALLPSLVMQGGGDPEEIVREHPLTAGTDPADLTAGVAAIAGYFVSASLQPVPAALPRIREFQRAQALPALDWLRRRLAR